MDISRTVEDRLVDLEVKASYTEDLLDHLSERIYRQQLQIEQLVQELRLLRDRWPESPGLGARDPRDDLPPHY